MSLSSIKDWLLVYLSLVSILQSTYTLGACHRPSAAVVDQAVEAMGTARSYRHIFRAGLPETSVASCQVGE